mmetsp:Transcript_159214/g.510747  ORF Transcript_159214/g.510747 Transcript_159214/m.510747 type:complete len:121 (+) Transcript_159214:1896-2258(+)
MVALSTLAASFAAATPAALGLSSTAEARSLPAPLALVLALAGVLARDDSEGGGSGASTFGVWVRKAIRREVPSALGGSATAPPHSLPAPLALAHALEIRHALGLALVPEDRGDDDDGVDG